MSDNVAFDEFVERHEPSLRRALAGHVPAHQVDDALSEAFLYAFANWHRVQDMHSPAGYLFRVAQSKSRVGRRVLMPPVPSDDARDRIEPGLIDAMRSLPSQQRSAVWLVHGCGWTYAEVAEALGITRSAVGTHVTRGLTSVRRRLGVEQ